MRVLLDACVLVPALTRGLLLGAAREGWFEPLWSERIFGEWQRAADKHGEPLAAATRTEQALLNHAFGKAEVAVPQRDDLWLPDADDVHVLSAAIAGHAKELLTANTGDFPTRILAQHGLIRRHPDEFLLELAENHSGKMQRVAADVLSALPNADHKPRTVYKRSGLNRFGKFLDRL